MANIKDIASLAGVSVTTVSRVLSGHPYVSDEKRRKVQQVIDQQGYTPNANAVHLIKGQTKTVGVIVPSSHSYFHAILSGIMDEASEAGYGTLLYQSRYDRKEEEQALHLLRTKQIDGLIFCSRSLPVDEIVSYGMYGPIVTCEHAEDERISSVYTDHHAAFITGMKHLTAHGHTDIGYCVGRAESRSSRQRYKAYTSVLDELGVPLIPEWIFENSTETKDGIRIVDKIMTMKKRPTALLITGDEVAAGVILQAQSAGLRIPEDLAIVGFDNLPISEALKLTTIDQHLKRIGQESFRAFYEMRDKGMKEKPKGIKKSVPFELVERASV
ncbi:LacI family DNA-binding transcriptional regulator [Paenibacillus sp. Marseille-Q4541]|uniref:LacI family DNA-binding transcriptional regulator n=1 Tax=Paenibacillus sp. Marseille-Q4541 TaxID=2831522 RepID=UPI001BAA2923|nr:LacI family DNA-binding transcriptional regulator [Paenibacillus sp. Marseille-Q4541]